MDEYSHSDDSSVASETEDGLHVHSSLPVGLPKKSKKRYEMLYQSFKRWCELRSCHAITEAAMLKYFLERSEVLKSSSSLWSEYSMLKTTIYINNHADISKFPRLKAFLINKNKGHRPKRSKWFTRAEIDRFLDEAPDNTYLLMKVRFLPSKCNAT